MERLPLLVAYAKYPFGSINCIPILLAQGQRTEVLKNFRSLFFGNGILTCKSYQKINRKKHTIEIAQADNVMAGTREGAM
jgi:hypothetical protein